MQLKDVDPRADRRLAASLLRVQVAAYRVEATLIDDDRIPTLHETVDVLRSLPLNWTGAFDGPSLLGAIAYSILDDLVDIDRLFVAPSISRHGIGRRLVREVLARADKNTVTVSTGRENTPARTFYQGLGFHSVGDQEVLPGLFITRYRLPAPPRR